MEAVMPDESRNDTDTIWVQTPSGPEPITIGGPLLVLPLSGARTGVTRDNAAIEEAAGKAVRANSVQEVCEAFDVRIEGQFEDVDHSTKTVNMPARDQRPFTV